MRNYLTLFQTLIQALETSDSVELIRQQLSEGTEPDYIRNVLKNHGLTADDGYVEFFASVDFVDIEWHATDDAIRRFGLEDSMSTTGRIQIVSFETALSEMDNPNGWFNIAWRNFATGNEAENPSLLPFDYFDPDRSGCACFDVAEKRVADKLTYFDHQFGTAPLGLSVWQYCQELSKNRGIYGWQRALGPEATTYSDQVTAAVAQLFG